MAKSLQDYVAQASTVGAAAASGAESPLALGKLTLEGAKAKVINADNFTQVYVAYAGAANKAKLGKKVVDLNDKRAVDQAKSKVWAFGQMAALPGDTDKIWSGVVEAAIARKTKNDGFSAFEHVRKAVSWANKNGKIPAQKDWAAVFPKKVEPAKLTPAQACVAELDKLRAKAIGLADSELFKGSPFAADFKAAAAFLNDRVNAIKAATTQAATDARMDTDRAEAGMVTQVGTASAELETLVAAE